jgi:hypothetical protein
MLPLVKIAPEGWFVKEIATNPESPALAVKSSLKVATAIDWISLAYGTELTLAMTIGLSTAAEEGAAETRPKPREATATRAMRLRSVFVDICFLAVTAVTKFLTLKGVQIAALLISDSEWMEQIKPLNPTAQMALQENFGPKVH